jgi:cell volume regulation protein A
VPNALAGVAEPLLFAVLGAAFADLVEPSDLGRGLVLTIATIIIIRPVVAAVCLHGSRLTRREATLVWWGGPKGAVPLLLGAYPALEGFEQAETVAAIVLVATATSLVIQGATLPYFNPQPVIDVTARTARAAPGDATTL